MKLNPTKSLDAKIDGLLPFLAVLDAPLLFPEPPEEPPEDPPTEFTEPPNIFVLPPPSEDDVDDPVPPLPASPLELPTPLSPEVAVPSVLPVGLSSPVVFPPLPLELLVPSSVLDELP